MNGIKILLTHLLLIVGLSQAQIADDFSDGDFLSNPAWQGDQGKFAVVGGRLKLQAPAVRSSDQLQP